MCNTITQFQDPQSIICLSFFCFTSKSSQTNLGLVPNNFGVGLVKFSLSIISSQTKQNKAHWSHSNVLSCCTVLDCADKWLFIFNLTSLWFYSSGKQSGGSLFHNDVVLEKMWIMDED